jgi:DNA-binding transcriptional LysR family regulator
MPTDALDQLSRQLSLRDLRMFLTVAERGNFAKAANSLAISRPVVSKSIANLERVLGVRLLDRSPQRVELTTFGHALFKRSSAVFDELRQSVSELKFLADPSSGELRIGASEYMAAGLIPAVIDRLRWTTPQAVFKLELDDAIGQLRNRKVEFVIARLLSPQVEADLDAEVLFHERVFVAAGPTSRWAGRRKVSLGELAKEQWILAPPEIVEGSPLVEAFGALGIATPQAKVLGLSLPLRNGLLATGRFLTIVPGSVLSFGAERMILKALPVELPDWRLPVALITLKNRTLSPPAHLFIEMTREMARPLARRQSHGETHQNVRRRLARKPQSRSVEGRTRKRSN